MHSGSDLVRHHCQQALSDIEWEAQYGLLYKKENPPEQMRTGLPGIGALIVNW